MTAREQRVAGRQLDAEVAERVMGFVWDAKRCRVCGWPLAHAAIINAHCLPDNCSQRPAPVHHAAEPAPYSTDIASAFLVVEAMRAKGWHWKAVGNCIAGEKYRAGFSVIGCVGDWDSTPEHHAAADSLPLAICLAALKALEAATPHREPTTASTSADAPQRITTNG